MAIDPRRQHDPDAGRTPERKADEASRDSFPASDAPAPTPIAGARAVPGSALFEKEPEGHGADTTAVTARFPDHESAKLAVEQLVRDGALDRRHVAIEHDDAGVRVTAHAPRDGAARVGELLRRCGGRL